MPITHLAVDSSVLVQAGWPKTSPELDSLFSLSATVKVIACVPELVELELEAKWRRELDLKRRQAQSRLNVLADHTRAFIRPQIRMPSEEEAHRDYLAMAEATKKAWTLRTCPNTPRPLGDLLRMAAFHQRPFPDADTCFRDAIIVLSIADYIDAENRATEAILVANDDFFKRPDVREFRTPGEALIRTVPDARSAIALLADMLTDVTLQRWEEESQQASEVLSGDFDALHAFVRDNLEVPTGLGLFGPKIVEVLDIDLKDIGPVRVPLPFKRPADGKVDVTISAVVAIRKIVDMPKENPAPPPTTLKVGQVREEPAPFAFTPRTREELTTLHTVRIVANGFLTDGLYERFEYVSVGFAPST